MNNTLNLWFTGLSGSGKTTLSNELARVLKNEHDIKNIKQIDGDLLRELMKHKLGFSMEDRKQNIRHAVKYMKKYSNEADIILASFITPLKEMREYIKKEIKDCIIIYVECPLKKCEERDVKGLYKKARTGGIENFTGISSPFDIPVKGEYDLKINTDNISLENSVNVLIKYLEENELLKEKGKHKKILGYHHIPGIGRLYL